MPDRTEWKPALALFCIAPAIGELLTGSTPLLKFINPLSFLVLAVLYGGGALLCREAMVRWRKGWLCLLVLGLAYGVVEEGLMVKSFFDPNWKDLGGMREYGRWLGVNWPWAVHLTLFHAVCSIAISVLLAHRLFRDRAARPWLSTRALWWLGAAFCGDVLLGFFAMTPYRPPYGPYLLAQAAVAGLAALAYQLKEPKPAANPRRAASPRKLAWFAFLTTFVWFAIAFALPPKTPPLTEMTAMVALSAWAAWWLVTRSDAGAAWTDEHRYALATGVLAYWALWDLGPALANAQVHMSGLWLVGIGVLVFRRWLRGYLGFAGAPPPSPSDMEPFAG